MTIKRRRGKEQLEYAIMCDRCSLVVSGWQTDCQMALNASSRAGWILAFDDYSGDLCKNCADAALAVSACKHEWEAKSIGAPGGLPEYQGVCKNCGVPFSWELNP